jgi:hypothetical protein
MRLAQIKQVIAAAARMALHQGHFDVRNHLVAFPVVNRAFDLVVCGIDFIVCGVGIRKDFIILSSSARLQQHHIR